MKPHFPNPIRTPALHWKTWFIRLCDLLMSRRSATADTRRLCWLAARGVVRWRTPAVFPDMRRLWTTWPSRLTHPNHAEYAEWWQTLSLSDGPFNTAFLDIPAVNRARAERV